MYSDDKIIEGIIRSDAEAYRMLFRRYYVVVHNFIQRLIKDADSAEDIAQNIFLKIWQGRHCLDSKRSIKGLLFAMAKNESLEDILRKLEEAEKEYSKKLEEIDLDAVIEKATHTTSK
jgi:RNA polymerase sigma-70 factor (ECF subfamily)